MALQVSIKYEGKQLTYDVESAQEEVYIFRMCENTSENKNGNYPQKLVIRRKGKIWISDIENHRKLVDCLIDEIRSFSPKPAI
jgi:hypothetical protein